MTKIKLCGLKCQSDIEAANLCRPDYIGFVFAPKSRRYVPPQQAEKLRRILAPGILAVGVFVDEELTTVAELLRRGVIDAAQLHGREDEAYIQALHLLTDKPILKAFRIDTPEDVLDAEQSTADCVLLDAGAGGTGSAFNWNLAKEVVRPYFLAGGLGLHNIESAIETLHPYAVDVSSGIETDGQKDPEKMREFVRMVRGKDEKT